MSVMQAFNNNKRLVAPLAGYPGVKLIDSTVKVALQNSKTHFDAVNAIFNELYPDMIFPLMQLTVEANALGLETIFPIHDVPQLKEGYAKIENIREEITKFGKIDILQDFGIKFCVSSIKRMAKKLPDNVVKGAYVIGPYTLSAMILGSEEALMSSLLNPDDLGVLCQFTAQIIKQYAEKLILVGAEAICILEPSAMMLYPEQFGEFSIKYVRDIAETCKKYEVSSILHICGNTMPLIEKMMESGVDGLSIDSKQAGVDLKKVVNIAENIKKDMVIIGNISPTETMLYGSPDKVASEVKELLNEMRDCPYFVLSTGCDSPPETPLENLKAFMKAGRGETA